MSLQHTSCKIIFSVGNFLLSFFSRLITIFSKETVFEH